MLDKYIIRSFAERNNELVDDRAICMHVALLGDMHSMETFSRVVHQDFFSPIEEKCFFEGEEDFRTFRNVDKFVKSLKSALPKKREMSVYFDGYLRTKAINGRLDIKRIERELERTDSYEACFEKEEIWKNKRLNNIRMLASDYPEEVREKIIVKKLLECKEPGPPTCGLSDLRCAFRCFPSWYQEDLFITILDIKIRLFSIGEALDDFAKWERKWLMDIGTLLNGVTGYVALGDFESDYSTPQMELFSDFPENDVIINEKRFLSSEWLMMCFTEGIEWANVLNQKVAERLKCLPEEIDENEGFEVLRLDNNSVAMNQKKDFTKYSPSDWRHVYPIFRECLRPGYSVDLDWDFFARNKFDIFVELQDFEVKEDKISFSRGIINNI